MKRQQINRSVVLELADAAAICRMLELWVDKRLFDNPIVAYETEKRMLAAKARLEQQIADIVSVVRPPARPEVPYEPI